MSDEKVTNLFPSKTASGHGPNLPPGGPGDNFGGMETRVAKLEARADTNDQRLERIEGKLDRIIERLGAMPTTAGLWGMVATVIATGLAIAGLTFMIASYAAG
jgi:hypothetical protein